MLALCLSFLLVVADRFTKLYISSTLAHGEYIPVFAGLYDLRYVRNTGAAWGIFAGMSHWLVVLSVVMLVVLVVWRRVFLTSCFLHRLVLGFMVGGILGNLIDRLKYGYVIDFLDFYWRGHHFPAFNIADSAICTGVAIYIITQFLPAEGATPSVSGTAGTPRPGDARDVSP